MKISHHDKLAHVKRKELRKDYHSALTIEWQISDKSSIGEVSEP